MKRNRKIILFISVFVLIANLTAYGAKGTYKAAVSSSLTQNSVPGIQLATLEKSEKPRYLYPIFDKVDVVKDIVYAEKKNYKFEKQKLKLDLYQPSGDAEKKRPAIIWVHGGGFNQGDKQLGTQVDLATEFAKRGYVTISIDYRLGPPTIYDMPTTLTDINSDALDALKWLRANSTKYKIDTTHIAIGGDSAGGAISLNLANCGSTSGKNAGEKGIFAVIDMFGPPTALYTDINTGKVPVLIIHGDMDMVVPYKDSVNFAKKLKNAGIYYEFFTMKSEGHTVEGIYRDDIILHTSRFLYKLLGSYTNPIFTIDKDSIKVTPGDSFKVTLTRNKSFASLIGKMDIKLPKGWNISGSTDIPKDKNTMEYIVNIPSDCPKEDDYLLFNQTFGNNKKDKAILSARVINPVDVSLTSELGNNKDISTVIKVHNNSLSQRMKGNITIDGISDGDKLSLDFSVAASQDQKIVIPQNIKGNLSIWVILDTNVSWTFSTNMNCLKVPYADTKPIIDGKLDEWTDDTDIVLDGKVQPVQIPNWKGIDDLSGKTWMKWDEKYLYLAALVNDNVHYETQDDTFMWQGDSIQVAIDPWRSKGAGLNGYFEMGFALTNAGKTQKWRWIAPANFLVGQADYIKYAASSIGTKIYYEAAIPWSSMVNYDDKIEPGRVMGFSNIINENDGSGRTGYMEYGGGIGMSKDAKLFIDMMLCK